MLALTVIPGIAKLALGMLALGLIHPGPLRLPRRRLIVLVLLAGIGLTLYGAVLTGEKVLMKLNVVAVPQSLGDDRVGRYLFFWDPLWLVGGILFLLAAAAETRAGR